MQEPELPADTVFGLLSNERRRYVLTLLGLEGRPLSLKMIATEIATRNTSESSKRVPEELYRSIYVSLYQNHVPRLADAGVVEYDDDERVVELRHTPQTRMLFDILDSEFTDQYERPYNAVFAASGIVGAIFLTGVVPMPGPTWLPGVLLLIGGLLAIGLHQYHYRHRIAIDGCVMMGLDDTRETLSPDGYSG